LKRDKYFFQKFPTLPIVGIIIAIVLLLIDLPSDFIGKYTPIAKVTILVIGNIILIFGVIEIVSYIIKLLSMRDFKNNLEEVKNNAISEIKKTNSVFIADFLSFRPWMSDEYFVKSKDGVPRYFYPMYLVIFSVGDDILFVNEIKINVSQKTWSLAGYHAIPLEAISSVGLVQDRILFTNYNGDNSATVYFIEIATTGGSIRIALFEEEILSSNGEIKTIRDEFMSKIVFLIRTVGKGRIQRHNFLI